MKEILNREARLIQNPALGAVLQWRFIATYADESKRGEGCPFTLAFLVLPILFYSDTLDILRSTQKDSGLHMFAGKFSGAKVARNDVLLDIHKRTQVMKNISLESLRLGFTLKLIILDSAKAFLLPVTKTSPKVNIPESTRTLIAGAEKLGSWCSNLTPYEIASILKVRF